MEAPGHVPPARSGSYPVRHGNRVRLLVDGIPAFRGICAAVEAARSRVWVTVAFVDQDVEMPDGLGTFFDVLDRAAARGLDVRVLFWREPALPVLLPDSGHFAGTAEERAWLRQRGAAWRARWDHLPRYCHHQKSWVVDAGEPGAVAFVGGINPDRGSLVAPGHPPLAGCASVHDVYLELEGPAVADVEHNFVQRWNEASEQDRPDGCWPDARLAAALPFPQRAAAAAGDVAVQVTRTVRAGCYRAGVAAPGAAPFAIQAGEQSALEQYLGALDAARRTIYLENQFLAAPEIVRRLAAAMDRGVEVVVVLPAEPMEAVRAARREAHAAGFFKALAALGEHPRCTLAGLSAGGPRPVYVHAKLAIVDDAWVTVGSTNLVNRSLHADTELNASLWDPAVARALRTQLFAEHLGRDVGDLDDVAALRGFAETARANGERLARGQPLDGLAIALDPAAYGS